MLNVKQESCEYLFLSLWFDPTRNRTPASGSSLKICRELEAVPLQQRQDRAELNFLDRVSKIAKLY